MKAWITEPAALLVIVAIWMLLGWCFAEALPASANEPPSNDLSERALAWVRSRPDGVHRLRAPGATVEIARVIEAADLVERNWPDAELLLALSWREARWTLHLRSRDGALGPVQIMPHLAPGRNLRDPAVAFTIAAGFLSRGLAECGSEERSLRKYASGECGPPRVADRRVMHWAAQMRGMGGGG